MLDTAKAMCFVATLNADRARDFYSKTLGLRLVEESPFALVFDSNGTMLRVQRARDLTPASHTAMGWEVINIAEAIRDLVANGVHFMRIDGLPQDELGIWTTPDGSKVAWFRDPDGNILSLTQFA
ncbi:MAG TPA: VOC family protein [Thermoanaerobaculia bacterium]|nr:VOC family protein [Thermoanaerobaculia bacterium]